MRFISFPEIVDIEYNWGLLKTVNTFFAFGVSMTYESMNFTVKMFLYVKQLIRKIVTISQLRAS